MYNVYVRGFLKNGMTRTEWEFVRMMPRIVGEEAAISRKGEVDR